MIDRDCRFGAGFRCGDPGNAPSCLSRAVAGEAGAGFTFAGVDGVASTVGLGVTRISATPGDSAALGEMPGEIVKVGLTVGIAAGDGPEVGAAGSTTALAGEDAVVD